MVTDKPPRAVNFSIIAAAIGAVATVAAALVAFFLSSNLPKATSTPSAYASLSFTGTVGINFDTNPPTVGSGSSSSFTATNNINNVDLTAKLPASLADINNNTANPPSLNACQTSIAHGSTLRLTVNAGNWACVRTTEGATKAIRVTNVTSSSAGMQVYVLGN
jgi:hypothetical protein